jgi:Ca2+-binding RTX toxin-like protein
VPHNATTTFYGTLDTAYGTSLCSSGPFPGSISYTHQELPCLGSTVTIPGANDKICGPDVIAGGVGDDTLTGGDGNDTVNGGSGKDTCP